jgi:hypothetical protein
MVVVAVRESGKSTGAGNSGATVTVLFFFIGHDLN